MGYEQVYLRDLEHQFKHLDKQSNKLHKVLLNHTGYSGSHSLVVLHVQNQC